MNFNEIPSSLKWGFGLAVATFFISMSSLSTSRGSSGYTCSYTDFAALILGGIIVLIGLKSLFAQKNPMVLGLSILVCALGALHIARGLGMVGSPCG